MTVPNYLAAAAADLMACNKCALCQEVCPAFAATTLETDGARGRNQLIRLLAAGELEPVLRGELRQRLATCLLCGACTTACPSGVATDRLVVAARQALAGPSGPPGLMGTVLHTLLRHPDMLDRVTSPLRLYELSGLRSLLTKGGTAPLPGRIGRMEAMIPPLPRRSFRAGLAQWQATVAQVAERWHAQQEARPDKRDVRVAYFCGCLTNAMFSGIAEAVYGVLVLNGYQVSVPDIACCGAAHEAYGDQEFLLSLARRNVDALSGSGIDVVVTDCATCAHTLIKYRELLADDPAYAARAANLATKVREVCQLLVEGGFAVPDHDRPLGPSGEPEAIAIAYHDPCHLARGLGVREQPRQVLRAVPGVVLRELTEPELCCGGAGSFAVTQPAISQQILTRKMDGFRATGAAQLATTCPACMLQLGAGLRLSGLAERPVHPCELLWRAYMAAADTAEQRL